jgi:hypothetical protein
MSERLLRCDIRDGMFSDEVSATFRTANGEQVSVFAPRDRVSGDGLRVMAFSRQGRWWIVLPTPEHQTVAVDQDQLVAA